MALWKLLEDVVHALVTATITLSNKNASVNMASERLKGFANALMDTSIPKPNLGV